MPMITEEMLKVSLFNLPTVMFTDNTTSKEVLKIASNMSLPCSSKNVFVDITVYTVNLVAYITVVTCVALSFACSFC